MGIQASWGAKGQGKWSPAGRTSRNGIRPVLYGGLSSGFDEHPDFALRERTGIDSDIIQDAREVDPGSGGTSGGPKAGYSPLARARSSQILSSIWSARPILAASLAALTRIEKT